jgi:hypothetical protein
LQNIEDKRFIIRNKFRDLVNFNSPCFINIDDILIGKNTVIISTGCLQHLDTLINMLSKTFPKTNVTIIAKQNICDELYHRFKSLRIIIYDNDAIFNVSQISKLISKKSNLKFDSCISLLSNYYGIGCTNIYDFYKLPNIESMYLFYINNKFSKLNEIVAKKNHIFNIKLKQLCNSLKHNF